MKLLKRILICSGVSLCFSLALINIDIDDNRLQIAKINAQSSSSNIQVINGVDIQYVITDRYSGAYRIELKINGNSNSDFEWQGSIDLPENHRILENYGVLISEGEDRVNFSGDSWNRELSQGDNSFAVLIIKGDPDEANSITFGNPINNFGEPKFSSILEEERRQFDPGFTVSDSDSPVFRRVDVEEDSSESETFSEEEVVVQENIEASEDNEEEVVVQENIEASEDSEEEVIVQENIEPSEDSEEEVIVQENIEASEDSEEEIVQENTEASEDSEEEVVVQENIEASEDSEEEVVVQETIEASEDNEEEVIVQENIEASEDSEEEIVAKSSDYENFGVSSGSGNFNYAGALDLNWLFFMANRSGPIGEDNVLDWRGDSTLNDGADRGVDLVGGYFDAGDHIKFILPMAYSMTMLAWSGVDYQDTYEQVGQFPSLLAAVRQGTDFLLKSHEVSGGKTQRLWVQVGDKEDHFFWVPPEKIHEKTARPSFAVDAANPGTDAAAGTAAALAAASMLFADVDAGYSAELLKNAIALFDFAETYKGKYSDSVSAANPFYTSWSGYEDELVMGAIWIYRASGESSYLTKAENYFKQGIGHIGQYTYVADDASYGALPLIAKASEDPFFKDEFQDWANYWLNAQGGVKHTSDGLAIRSEWASVPLALSSSYLLEWYNDFVEPNQAYSQFAQQQIDYVLGDNSMGLSYLIGFGDNFPLRPHHRGSAGSQPLDGGDSPNDNVLYGAIVGGPRNDDFSHNDRRDDWVTNEVGTSYNAPFAASAIQQIDNSN